MLGRHYRINGAVNADIQNAALIWGQVDEAQALEVKLCALADFSRENVQNPAIVKMNL